MSLHITLKCRSWTLSLSEKGFSALFLYTSSCLLFICNLHLAMAVRAPRSRCWEETQHEKHSAYLTRSYLDLTGVWSEVIIMKSHYTAYACDGYIIHMPVIPVQPTREESINPACYRIVTSPSPLWGRYRTELWHASAFFDLVPASCYSSLDTMKYWGMDTHNLSFKVPYAVFMHFMLLTFHSLRHLYMSILSIFLCSNTDVHTVASLLKLYLRELPEPVIPFCKYEEFLACTKLLSKDQDAVSCLLLTITLQAYNPFVYTWWL